MFRLTAIASLLCSVALICAPTQLAAQPGAPTISFSPPAGEFAPGTQILVTVTFCDDNGLNLATRQLTVNGSAVGWPVQASYETPGPCYHRVVQSGTVTVGALVRAFIEDNAGLISRWQQANYFAAPAWNAIKVVAEQVYRDVAPSSTTTQRFTVHNLGDTSQTVSFTAVNADLSVAGTATPASQSIGAGASATVTVSTTTRAAADTIGRVWLRAVAGTSRDSAFTQLRNVALSTPVNGVVLLNPTGVNERALCVSASAGPSAAMECGDLRLSYALPGVQTRGKARVPTLLYSSHTARPTAMIPAALTITAPVGGETYTAVVHITGGPLNGTQYPAGSWVSSDFGSGGARQITASFDAALIPTGRHPYRLDITRTGGTTYSATGELLIVNRLASPFNAGWWLAGVEQLVMTSDTATTLLLAGGDGSTRVYRRTSSCRWAADPLEAPDTIAATPSGARCVEHTRLGPNRLRIRFDSAGRHVWTANRLGDTTRFSYDGSGRLVSIQLPSGSQAMAYTFAYGAGGTLESVSAPGAGSARVVNIHSVTGAAIGGVTYRRIRLIAFPDTLHGVRFEYSGAVPSAGTGEYRASGRRDRMGVLTSFALNAQGKLTQSRVQPNAADTIVHTFRSAESMGVGSGGSGQAFLPDSVYTRIDGPRGDVADVMQWWLNGLGAPTRVRNPVGEESHLTYATAWPALPRRVFDPGGVQTLATYNTRGLATEVRVKAPFGSGDAVTTYTWDSTWDVPTSITDAAGVVTSRTYVPSTGNLRSERVGADTLWTTWLTYDTQQLLSEVLSPGAANPERFEYDPLLVNVRQVRSPLGVRSTTYRDAIGRDTLRIAPLDVATDTLVKVMRTRLQYDAVGRVSQTVDSAAAMPYTLVAAPVESRPVELQARVTITTYDRENRPLTINSYSVPDSAPNSACTDADPLRLCYGAPPNYQGTYDTRTYDAIGRLLRTRLGSGPRTVVYDVAGNVVADSMWSGAVVRYTFDAANRMVRRIVPGASFAPSTCEGFAPGQLNAGGECWMLFPVYPNDGASGLALPADTARFVFDYAGRLVRADNREARISRSYFAAGALRTDTLRIRSYGTTSFTTTVFGTRQSVDAAGRRQSLVLPTALADDSLVYAYDAQRGFLREITQGSRRVRVALDRAGRQDSLVVSRLVSGSFVAGIIERRAYDDDDHLRWRERKRGTGQGIITDSLSYDARGRMRRVWSSSAATEVGLRTITNAYSGMGAVVASEESKGGAWWEAEQYRTNALGQVWFSRADKGATATPYPQRSHYNHNGAVVARQPLRTDPADTITFDDTTYTHVDQAGNITRSGSRSRFQGANTYVAVRNYYRSDNRLAVVQRYSYTNSGRDGAWEEFRYDALGRKVLSRIRREGGGVYTALCSGDCVGTVERTIWDGDNILYELRVDGSDARTTTQLDALTSVGPNWGKAGYLHFGGIDQPVMLFDGRVPNYDWRGMPESSSWADGTPADCAMGTGTCTVISWPAGTSVYYKKFSWATGPSTPPQWVGSLLANGAGGTGLLYRRNRFYDPSTGQFTQQDPIGISGGLSVYGFAAGDPVNFSDPFGLCVLWIRWCPPRDAHYARNAFNQGLPKSIDVMQALIAEDDSKWRREPDNRSRYHRHGTGNENLVKFTHEDGFEAVYDPTTKKLVTDVRNLGTFNFASRDKDGDHLILDMIPYWIWGNAPNDPTPLLFRILGPPSRDPAGDFLRRMEAAGVPITVRR